MILPTIIVLIVILFAVTVYLSMKSPLDHEEKNEYLEQIARLFESRVQDIPGAEGSREIAFHFRGWDCTFQELAITTSKGDMHYGYLKVQTQKTLTLSFTERSRARIRANVQSLEDVAANKWGNSSEAVEVPKELHDFYIHTNQPSLANLFLKDERILKCFVKYKNRDQRGHPQMSLQVNNGAVTLEFHPAQVGLKPSIMALEQNASEIERYLQELFVPADILNNISSDI